MSSSEPDPNRELQPAPIRDLAGAQSNLAGRLDALERELRRLTAGRDDKARLDKLQEAVADLAAGHHDVHRQLDALTDAVDQMATDEDSDDSNNGGPRVANRPRPATFVPPVASRFPRLKRWAQAILRLTLGKARHLWDTTHPRPPWGDDLRRIMQSSPAKVSTLAVAMPGVDYAGASEARLERQTDRDLRPLAPGEPVTSDYVWDVAPGHLAPTFVESARLLLTAEDLGFVCFETEDASIASQWIVSRELCDADGHLDLQALGRWAKRQPNRVLGKIVGGDEDLLPRALCRPEIRRRVRRAGAYVVSVSTRPRTISHRLSPLDTGLKTRATKGKPPEGGSQVPGSLVLLVAELAGGLERVVAGMLELTDRARPVLATTVPQGFWSTRWRALERYTPLVYDLGGVFAAEQHEEVLELLINRHGVRRVVPAGGAIWPKLADRLRRRFPELEISAPLSTLPVDTEPTEVTEGTRERVRADLGISPETLLVVMHADLIADQRPEDFVALAHRFRDDDRFFFLLVGDGPLSSNVRDLERLLALRDLRIEPPRQAAEEILAAADIACSTAESAPFPFSVHAALRHRRPVVAAAADDLPRLLGNGPCGLVVPHAGDLEGFETALRSLVDVEKRRQLGDRGPAALRHFQRSDA